MINIAIMGFGTIGSGVFEVIGNNNHILKKEIGDDIRVAKVLDIRDYPGEPVEKLIVHDIREITEDKSVNIVVETMGGTSPAFEFVDACLKAGKHVVTSNKALVAAYGDRLLKSAAENSVNFLFEASVGGGIPVIRTLSKAYAGEYIKEITGILNGTTNYILTKMGREGESFGSALLNAQELGYAERNPEADIEGHDTCRKIAILASLASGKRVDFEKIHTEGIAGIEEADFEYASMLGASVKLFGSAVFEDDKLYAYVCPKLIGSDNTLCMVNDVFNAIMIEGNMLGKSMLYGSGAGKLPTASAVVADIISAARHMKENVPMGWSSEELIPEPVERTSHRYLVRFSGKAAEDIERCRRAFAGSTELISESRDEFAILTGRIREKDFLTVAANLTGMIKYIRADIN